MTKAVHPCAVMSIVDTDERPVKIDGESTTILALTVFPEGEPPRTSREAYCIDHSLACELVELYNKAQRAADEKEAHREHSAGAK